MRLPPRPIREPDTDGSPRCAAVHGTAPIFLLFAVLATAAACGAGLAAPEELHLTAEIAPDPVIAGESFVARVTVTNTGSDPFVLDGDCRGQGPQVLKDGEQLNFEGASPAGSLACVVSPPDTVRPDAALVYEYPMRAVLNDEPADPGSYVFRLETTVEGVESVERAFTVIAPD